jgi:predicted nucleic acid-binding protein
MRVDAALVIDSNVLISAALSTTSPPARIVRHALAQGRLLFSDATFAELQSRLWRPAAGVWVDIPAELSARAFSRDPDDDKFIHVALAASADAIASGDQDLLVLSRIGDLPVLTPGQACALLAW